MISWKYDSMKITHKSNYDIASLELSGGKVFWIFWRSIDSYPKYIIEIYDFVIILFMWMFVYSLFNIIYFLLIKGNHFECDLFLI